MTDAERLVRLKTSMKEDIKDIKKNIVDLRRCSEKAKSEWKNSMGLLNKLNRRKNPNWGDIQECLQSLDHASRVIINCDEELPQYEDDLEDCEVYLAELKAQA